MNTLKLKLATLIASGFKPEDDEKTRLKKAALTLVPLIIGSAAFVWGTVYILLGHPLSGSIPLSYSIISVVTLVYYFKSNETEFLEKSQLVLVLILPFLLMWSLGGFFNGSTVMIWALFSPIAASMFLEKKHAFAWFISYIVLLIISAFLNNTFENNVTPLPDLAITIFFVLNIGAGSAGLYLLTSFTINQQKSAVTSLSEERTKLELSGEDLLKINKLLIKATNKAELANETKSEFLANMSHELRTPLHAILSYSQLGIDNRGKVSEEKIHKYFSNIMASGERLKVLLNDLLDLSKLEAGKMKMDLSLNDIASITDSCISEQTALIEHKNLTVKTEIDNAFPAVMCDKNRIGQVLMNLLSNAIKFSADGGEIIFMVKEELSTENNTRMLHMSISDQGMGIPEGEETEIFKKFIQSSNQTYESGGTGLGLAITQELIHAHHGRIWCENKSEGGAIFHFMFPMGLSKD